MRYSLLHGFPPQRLSYEDKVKNDYEWAKDVVRAITKYVSDTMPGRPQTEDYERMVRNYRWYNGDIDSKEFERECNIFGLEVDQIREEVLPYSKAPNKINTLLGEEIKRPFNYRTVLVNSSAVRYKMKLKNQMLEEYFMAKLKEIVGEFTSKEEFLRASEGLLTPEEIDKYFSTEYRDIREHYADTILHYLSRTLDLKGVKNDSFAHALKSGYEIVKVGVANGMPKVEVINPLNAFWHKSPETKYIQDALFAGHTKYMTIGEVLDTYGEYLTEEEIARLEGRKIGGDLDDKMRIPKGGAIDKILTSINFNTSGTYGHTSGEYDVSVTHVEWRSQKKIGFIEFIDDDGQLVTTMVSEDFEIPDYAVKQKTKQGTIYHFDGIQLKWGWIPEIWEATVIDGDIYVNVGPRDYQYRSVDDPFNVKLSYHGITYSAMNASPTSLMDRIIPFDRLFIIAVHKLKTLLAKDRGQVFHFDLSMVNPKLGLEKTLYYLNELDIDFYDPLQNASQPGAYQRGKITGATSRSNMQHIMSYINLIAAIDMQISDIAGITRQREGWISPDEAVGNSQQSINRSAVITEAVYFRPHDQLWAEVLNSLVQCAQIAFKDKRIIRQFVLDDLSVASIDLDPLEFSNADFGVFISNATNDNEMFEAMRYYAQALIQNDKIDASGVMAIFEATSVNKLKRAILEGERRRQMELMQQLQAQQQAEMQAQQAEAQLRAAIEDARNQARIATEQIRSQTDITVQQLENEADLEVARIRSEKQSEKK